MGSRSLRRLVTLALLSLALVSLVGCHRRPQYAVGSVLPGGEVVTFTPAPTTVVIAGTPDPTEMRASIARALEARHFTLEASDATSFVARLTSRGQSIRVSVTFTPQEVVVTYLDSTGLSVDDTGVSRNYDAWMRNLSETLQDEIARPARERQEAVARSEEAQRQHERQMQDAQLQAQRDARDAEERTRERDRQERLERERLATARAEASADAARSQAITAEIQARPRVEVGTYASVQSLGFDGARARRGRGVLSVELGFGDSPRAARGQAGGPESATSMGFPDACPGWFDAHPQHTVVITSDEPYLRIEAPSETDTTIAIVSPDGSVWCDDDSAGNLAPRLEGFFPAGVYQVYVGTYSRGASGRYDLLFSERRPAAPAAPVVQAAPDCRQTLLSMGHSATQLMFCSDRVEPYCADALLRAGHSPTQLQFCEGVQASCAVALIQQGQSPTLLMNCR